MHQNNAVRRMAALMKPEAHQTSGQGGGLILERGEIVEGLEPLGQAVISV